MNDYLGLLLKNHPATSTDLLIALGITAGLVISFFAVALLIINKGIRHLKPMVAAAGINLSDDDLERLFTQDSLLLTDGRTLKYRLLTNTLTIADQPEKS